MLDALRHNDDWLVAPFTFGYAIASRPTDPRPLTWHDLPRDTGGARASILGGAGLGLSASAANPEAAMAFMTWFVAPQRQRELSVPQGGQPASAEIWDDPDCDAELHGFYSATRRTIDAAFIRPSTIWWPAFQDAAGRLLASAIKEGTDTVSVEEQLRSLHAKHVAADAPVAGEYESGEPATRVSLATAVGDPHHCQEET